LSLLETARANRTGMRRRLQNACSKLKIQGVQSMIA